MKFIIICLCIGINFIGFSQPAPGIEWQKNFGGSLTEQPSSIIQTSDGGYIVAGYTASANGDILLNHGGDDVWIFKLDQFGAISWNKTYGGSLGEKAWY